VVFEVIRSITDDAPAPCKTCGGQETERLISQSSFVLKGSGWYKTDYGTSGSAGTDASANSSKEDSATPSTSAGSEKKSDAGADKKPASASPSTKSVSAD